MRIPDDEETKQLLQVICPRSPFGLRDIALMNLALNTGLRVAELTGLDVKDVWFQATPQTLLDLPPSICKYARSRQIPLNSGAREAIAQLVGFLRHRGFSTAPDAPLLARNSPHTAPFLCVQAHPDRSHSLRSQRTPRPS